jgi:hypothetical protein
MVIAILATFINDSIAVEIGFIWRRGNILLTFSDVRFQNFSELSGLDGSMVNRGGGCEFPNSGPNRTTVLRTEDDCVL